MRKIYYGWIICAVCTLVIFVTMGAVSNGFSIFLPFIMENRGFSPSQTSFLVTIRCIVSFVAMLLIGTYYNFFSIRKGVSIAVACTGAAYCIYSAADSYLFFAAGAALSGLSYGFGSMVPVSILMSKWFVKNRALTIGLCSAGSSAATIIMSPVTTLLVENISMEAAFLIEGLIFLMIALIVIIFLRNDPAEKGLEPYGQNEIRENAAAAGKSEEIVSHSLSRKGWIYMGIVALSMGALANPSFAHLSVLFTTEGFKPMTVAAIISAIGIALTASKILFGHSADKIGGCRTSVLFLLILLAGHICCCFSYLQNLPLCIVTAILMGVGFPIATVGISVWAGDMASLDKYPEVLRKFQIFYAAGALVFSSSPGVIAEVLGRGYIPSYIMFSVMLVINLMFILCAYKENKKAVISKN